MLAKRKIIRAGKPLSLALVGLMGVGKSTIGARLAASLGLPFVDADKEVEAAAGMAITEIFDRFGEAHFRDGERRVIERLVGEGPIVLATGGGAFMNERTRALLLEETIAIWLDAEIDTLAERVGRRDHRPLLHGKDPVAVLSDLAAERNPVYAEAHLRVESGEGPATDTADLIIARLEEEGFLC
ncbi:MAG: shikimate kinase [Pacificimonas sp.]|jgi:shikimate kinase|nr:shikimate kinase [Pacificimonas sp.]